MDPLHARVRSELDTPSFSDPDDNLSYVDRQHLKEGNYAALARDRLPRIHRQLKWTTVSAITAGLLLLMSTVLSGMVYIDADTLTSDPGGLAVLFFMASAFGISALIRLWQARTLERRTLLFELVIERDAASDAPPAQEDAPSPEAAS